MTTHYGMGSIERYRKAMSVPCPKDGCGAEARERCTVQGNWYARWFHAGRIHLAFGIKGEQT